MRSETVTKINDRLERVIPAPGYEESGTTRIPAWDTVTINAIIEVASKWARVNHPVHDTFEHLWPMVQSDLNRDRTYRLYCDVRNLLPDLPVVVNRYGDHPGAPGYMELSFSRDDNEDFRHIRLADPFDEEPYISTADGTTVLMQVWYTDDTGDLDIIELDHMDPVRLALAVRHMWNKYNSFYRNTESGA